MAQRRRPPPTPTAAPADADAAADAARLVAEAARDRAVQAEHERLEVRLWNLLRAFGDNWRGPRDEPEEDEANPDADARAKRIRRGLPAEEWIALYRRELLDAQEAVFHALARVEELRSVLPEPTRYAEVRREIVEDWNRAVNDGEWQTIPTLCEGCGNAIRRREGERLTREPPWVCSDSCRQRRRQRGRRMTP